MILCHLLHVYIRIAPSYGQRKAKSRGSVYNLNTVKTVIKNETLKKKPISNDRVERSFGLIMIIKTEIKEETPSVPFGA